MNQNLNIDREFIKWYYDEQYPEMGSNRSMVHASGNNNVEIRDYWMREAYKSGARAMAQDMLNTLCDYACAVEGLDPELITPSEVYDRARENLFTYVTKVLDKS